MKRINFTLFSAVLLLCSSCLQNSKEDQKLALPFNEYSMKNDPAQKERDEIYGLLAYSLVLNDWQSDTIPRNKRRGYNIGCVLVNESNEVVDWALNCVNETNNSTQHGEVRAILKHLKSTGKYNLSGYTLYTTLEPCAMCAGMITMTNIKRVVFGQSDVDYSKALNRLALDSRMVDGYAPYPRVPITDRLENPISVQLDSVYKLFYNREEENFISRFLSTQEAKNIYKKALNNLMAYKVKYDENIGYYNEAIKFYTEKEK